MKKSSVVSRQLSVISLAAAVLASSAAAQNVQKITINFPTRSGASWPMYIAKEGGYY